jgi:hippurate hydrolase
MTTVTDAAGATGAELVDLRRRLHRTPEVGLHLPKTRALVLQALDGLGLESTTSPDCSGAAAVLHGAEPGPVVLLRADMDALPLTEQTGVDDAFDGPRMHACGHDLHMTMLVGGARFLCERRSGMRGSVVFMFQPGEEGYFGARRMIDAGILTAAGREADAAYALHVAPALVPRGVVATRPGPLLASVDCLRVVVHGESGHGARSAPGARPDPRVGGQGRKGKRSLLSRCASRTSPYRRSTPTDCPGPITM